MHGRKTSEVTPLGFVCRTTANRGSLHLPSSRLSYLSRARHYGRSTQRFGWVAFNFGIVSRTAAVSLRYMHRTLLPLPQICAFPSLSVFSDSHRISAGIVQWIESCQIISWKVRLIKKRLEYSGGKVADSGIRMLYRSSPTRCILKY